jgi:predicted transcriptional regulator
MVEFKQVNVRLTLDQLESLERLAEKRGIPKSILIRQAVIEFLERQWELRIVTKHQKEAKRMIEEKE